MTTTVILSALLIFVLRVINMSLDTLRIVMVARDQKLWTWLIGFVQTIVYVYILNFVLQDLTNPLNLIAYAAGFSTGNVAGMYVDNWLAMGFKFVRIISSENGLEIAEFLRDEGFAVTELQGKGRDGDVTILNVGVRNKQLASLKALVADIDDNAMMTSEEVRPIQSGLWR